MAHIYVSSTLSDLKDHRKEVSSALRRLGHEDVAMEKYVAQDNRPLDQCLADVASSNVYVGIFAFRYGHVPPENNPEGRSITELEYRQALAKGVPCLIFLMSEDAPWPKSKGDKGVAADQIEKLRQELTERHVVNFFENIDELTRKVNEAVINWEKATGLIGKRQLTDWDAYREAVRNRHQWVRLQVIAGANKDRGPLKIPLTEVFQPQLVAPGASATDVPDEVRKYQEGIYGLRTQVPEETESNRTAQDEATDPGADSETEETLLAGNPELVLDILARETTQVILGGPGSGKSTILHYAMLRMCDPPNTRETLPPHLQASPIPFLIELRNYVLQKESDFIGYIVNRARDFYAAAIDVESVGSMLDQDGQAVVFFDGLDEVFDPDERREVIDEFQSFAHRYPGTRIVVTSRIAGYDRTALGLAGFEHYTLLPLTLGQIRHFANQWYQYYTLEGTERTAEGLVQRIVENPRLLDLAGNPLLLTMMAVIYKDRDLPNERWRLYERCAETLLEDWDLGKGIEDEDFKLAVLIRTAQKSEILQRVSLYMLENGQTGRELNAIAYAPLLDIVAGYLEEKYQRPRGDAEAIAVDILRHLMERTYVLAGIGERIFGFVHRTFMEYFAACRCQAQFNASKADFAWLNRDIFGAHWRGGEWEEVLLLLIAMLHDQGTPIREVLEFLRNECRTSIPFNVAFAARCLGEAGDVQDAVQAQALLVELAQAIADYAPQSRKKEAPEFVETALKAFAVLAPLVTAPLAVRQAIDKLNKAGTVATRMAAWQMAFALRSHKERLDYALAALKDKEEVVRRGAIAALEREWPGRADIGPVLSTVVRDDRQSRVRQAALTTMQRSWRHEPSILDAIASRADEETAYTYVTRLIDYLAATWRGNTKARDLVIKLAGPKPKARWEYDYAMIIKSAGKALAQGWRGDSEALKFLQGCTTVQSRPDIRAAAFEAIADGWPEDRNVLAFIQDYATNDPAPGIRAAALGVIAKAWAGDADILVFLQGRALEDPDEQTRLAALSAIAGGWRDDGLAFLQEVAESSPDPNMRTGALQTISRTWFGADRALEFLKERGRSDSDPQIRAAVCQAIALQWPSTEPVLAFFEERVLTDPDPVTRLAAIQAVAVSIQHSAWRFGFNYDDGSLPRAIAFLSDRASSAQEIEVRTNAIKSLANLLAMRPYLSSIQLSDISIFLQNLAMQDPLTSVRVVTLRTMFATEDRYPHFMPGLVLDWWGREFVNQSLTFLREQATINAEAETRSNALVALAAADQTSLAFISDRARNDPDARTRLAGVQAIRWYWSNKTEARAFLAELAKTEPDEGVRSAIREKSYRTDF